MKVWRVTSFCGCKESVNCAFSPFPALILFRLGVCPQPLSVIISHSLSLSSYNKSQQQQQQSVSPPVFGVWTSMVCRPSRSDGASSLGALDVVLAGSFGVSLGMVGVALLFNKFLRFIHSSSSKNKEDVMSITI